ncbi:hypothetical protein PKHYL_22310 [Psychrobacter sp. KH172YL61]|nr:hypothetical protein PKHYL_22310 [Psychrobacter sp. KH172YL61]
MPAQRSIAFLIPFNNAAELLEQCRQYDLSISELVLANECHFHDKETVFAYLDSIWEVMQDCVKQGCENGGILPGGLDVKRRAQDLHRQLSAEKTNLSPTMTNWPPWTG